jgi:hypothetical protein
VSRLNPREARKADDLE